MSHVRSIHHTASVLIPLREPLGLSGSSNTRNGKRKALALGLALARRLAAELFRVDIFVCSALVRYSLLHAGRWTRYWDNPRRLSVHHANDLRSDKVLH